MLKGLALCRFEDIRLSPFLPSYEGTFPLLFATFPFAAFHSVSYKCYTALQSDHVYT
jgi:hypothetical protein